MFACPELPSHLSGGAHKLAPNIHKTTVNGHFYRNNCIFFCLLTVASVGFLALTLALAAKVLIAFRRR